VFRSHFASHRFAAILGMALSMLQNDANEIVINAADPTEAVGMKRKRWKELCHPDWVHKKPFAPDRYEDFERDGGRVCRRSYPPDCLKHWCHPIYHSLVPSHRQQAMIKWYSEMPKVETEPAVVSVCPLALVKQGHEPAKLGYLVGNVKVYYELRYGFWRQGIAPKRYVIMSQFWLPELDTSWMSTKMRMHMERERRELVLIGPWTQELTMVFLWGREPVLQSYTKDDCWWPIYPWHPNHKNRVQYEWVPALRRYKTLGE